MITCFFGLPGCGKSTMLASIAAKELKRIKKGKSKYKRVLSNYYIKGCDILFFDEIGYIDMSNSLIIIDEISLDCDSRDYKKFSYNLKQFFILHRHYNIDIVYATQQYDGVDRKIRELTENLFWMRKIGQITFSTSIYRTITITQESDIKNGYIKPSKIELLFNPIRNIRFCFRPFYYKYFDSFEAPIMRRIEFKKWGSLSSGEAALAAAADEQKITS